MRFRGSTGRIKVRSASIVSGAAIRGWRKRDWDRADTKSRASLRRCCQSTSDFVKRRQSSMDVLLCRLACLSRRSLSCLVRLALAPRQLWSGACGGCLVLVSGAERSPRRMADPRQSASKTEREIHQDAAVDVCEGARCTTEPFPACPRVAWQAKRRARR